MNKNIVLFVEDDPDDLKLTLTALRDILKPYQVDSVCDGVEALDYLLGRGACAGRDTRRKPDLIVLDLNLPRLDGLEFLHRLNDEWGAAAVSRLKIAVFTSASASEEDPQRRRAQQLGAKHYLRKPVSLAESEAFVREMGALLGARP